MTSCIVSSDGDISGSGSKGKFILDEHSQASMCSRCNAFARMVYKLGDFQMVSDLLSDLFVK